MPLRKQLVLKLAWAYHVHARDLLQVAYQASSASSKAACSLLVESCVHKHMRKFVPSITHWCIHPSIHVSPCLLIFQSCIHTLIPSLIHLCTHVRIYSCNYSLIHTFIQFVRFVLFFLHSYIHTYIHSFARSSTHLCICAYSGSINQSCIH